MCSTLTVSRKHFPFLESVSSSEIFIWRVHCVKIVQIRSYFWSVFSCIQSEYRKIRTRNNSVFGHFSLSGEDGFYSVTFQKEFVFYRFNIPLRGKTSLAKSKGNFSLSKVFDLLMKVSKKMFLPMRLYTDGELLTYKVCECKIYSWKCTLFNV